MIRRVLALVFAFLLIGNTVAVTVFAQEPTVDSAQQSKNNAKTLLHPFYSNACGAALSEGTSPQTTPTQPAQTGSLLDSAYKVTDGVITGEKITPKAIILHWTVGDYDSPETLIQNMANRTDPKTHPDGRAVQLTIDKEGKVYQLSESLDTKPRQSMEDSTWNDVSIGIEIESSSFEGTDAVKDNPSAPYEAELLGNTTQYQAVVKVVSELVAKYSISTTADVNTKSGIFGHHEANPGSLDVGDAYVKKVRDNVIASSNTPTAPAQPLTEQAAGSCICSAQGNVQAQASGSVYVVGDSIIDWFANAPDDKAQQFGVEPRMLEKEFTTKGWKPTISAKGGRQLVGSHYVTPDGKAQMETDKQAITDADAVVIALGTNRNDPWGENTKEGFRTSVQEVVNNIKAINKKKQDAKIYWVNLAYTGDTLSTDPPGNYPYASSFAEYNAVLSEESAGLGFQIIDWQGAVSANPALIGTEYGDLDGYAHVHPSADGAKEYVTKISSAIGAPASGATAAVPTSSQTGVVTSGFAPDPAAVEIFTKDLMPKIQPLIPLYQRAAQEENMADWEVLPALHNLEFSLRKDNPEGNLGYASPFQMSKLYIEEITGVSPNDPVFKPGKMLTDDEFVRVAKLAIEYMRGNAGFLKLGDLSQPLTAEQAGKLILSYKSGAGSEWFRGQADFNLHAYTWAGYDTTPAHKLPMAWGPGSSVRDEQPSKKVGQPGAATVFMLLKGGVVGTGQAVGNCAGATSGGLVNAEGYAFPVEGAKKSTIKSFTQLPCTAGPTGCHHDNTAAFDLLYSKPSDTQGKKVFAISDGVVDYVKPGYDGYPHCVSISFTSTKDKFRYMNLHMTKPLVASGATISAGQPIAEIGPAECGRKTVHLHIDRGCIKNGVPQVGGGDSCRDPGIIDLINTLYEGLPE
jgi:lysophospholipase L1-like esterase